MLDSIVDEAPSMAIAMRKSKSTPIDSSETKSCSAFRN